MKRKAIITAVAAMLTCLVATGSVFAASMSFADVKANDWFYPYVTKMVEKGGITGYPDGTFKPQNTITNAEFVTAVVGSTLGKQQPTEKHWASGYMDAAKTAGLIVGDEMPQASWNQPITREKMAVIIARTTDKVLKEEPVQNTDQLKSQLKDYDQICDYCKDYVMQAYAKGIISGYPDGTFGGQKTATRAEACSILARMLEPAERKSEQAAPAGDTGKIGDVIKNPQDIFGGRDLTTYEIVDPSLYHMTLWTDKVGGKYIQMDQDPRMTFFVVNGQVKDIVYSGKNDNGKYDIQYHTVYQANSQNNIDISTVDYIGSYTTVDPVVKLIPNPFKHQ